MAAREQRLGAADLPPFSKSTIESGILVAFYKHPTERTRFKE